MCDKTYCTYSSLAYHWANAHQVPQAKFLCIVRGKRFTTLPKKLDHLKKCQLKLSNTCKACGRVFATRPMLLQHRRSVHQQPATLRGQRRRQPLDNFPCQMCGRVLVGRHKLLQHQSKVHRLPLKCDLCHVEFATPVRLWKHEMNHKQQRVRLKKTRQCRSCQQPLVSSKPRLSKSVSQCDSCHKKSVSSYDGQALISVDDLDDCQRLSCDKCAMTFVDKASLRRHRNKTHRPVRKAWQCQHCLLENRQTPTFPSLSILRSAMRYFHVTLCNMLVKKNE